MTTETGVAIFVMATVAIVSLSALFIIWPIRRTARHAHDTLQELQWYNVAQIAHIAIIDARQLCCAGKLLPENRREHAGSLIVAVYPELAHHRDLVAAFIRTAVYYHTANPTSHPATDNLKDAFIGPSLTND